MANPLTIPRDFLDLLEEFAASAVEYLVIGGYAVGYHDRPRTTKDLDLLIGASSANAQRAAAALEKFGAPLHVVEHLRVATEDEIVWLGQPPLRIDILKAAPGIDFQASFSRRVEESWQGVHVNLVGIDDLIRSKRAAGRPQDRLDVKHLERARERKR